MHSARRSADGIVVDHAIRPTSRACSPGPKARSASRLPPLKTGSGPPDRDRFPTAWGIEGGGPGWTAVDQWTRRLQLPPRWSAFGPADQERHRDQHGRQRCVARPAAVAQTSSLLHPAAHPHTLHLSMRKLYRQPGPPQCTRTIHLRRPRNRRIEILPDSRTRDNLPAFGQIAGA